MLPHFLFKSILIVDLQTTCSTCFQFADNFQSSNRNFLFQVVVMFFFQIWALSKI